MTDPYAPFDRCGWTVQRSQHFTTTEPDVIRVSKDGYFEYLTPAQYDELAEDEVFVGILEHHRRDAQ